VGIFTTLAQLFQHALLIFLSGQYDYFPLLQEMHPTCRRSPPEIQQHVLSIIHLTEQLITQSQLARILYVFPLRVAGARANCSFTATKVLSLIARISDGGFKVADRVAEDLKTIWTSRNLEYAGFIQRSCPTDNT
jgi:hypothetical protein